MSESIMRSALDVSNPQIFLLRYEWRARTVQSAVLNSDVCATSGQPAATEFAASQGEQSEDSRKCGAIEALIRPVAFRAAGLVLVAIRPAVLLVRRGVFSREGSSADHGKQKGRPWKTCR